MCEAAVFRPASNPHAFLIGTHSGCAIASLSSPSPRSRSSDHQTFGSSPCSLARSALPPRRAVDGARPRVVLGYQSMIPDRLKPWVRLGTFAPSSVFCGGGAQALKACNRGAGHCLFSIFSRLAAVCRMKRWLVEVFRSVPS